MLLSQAEGHIVNTSSFAGLFTYSYDRMPYAATKAAIVQISEALAIYLRPKNIGVTLLCPGPVLTNIANNIPRFGPGAPMRLPGDEFELVDAAALGDLLADAIMANRFYLTSHPQVRELLISLPKALCLLAYRGIVGLLKVPPTPPERCDDRGGHLRFQQRLSSPVAVAHVHQIDRGSVVVVVIEIRSGEPAEPEQPIRIAGPHE